LSPNHKIGWKKVRKMKRTLTAMLGIFTIAIMMLGTPMARAAETPSGTIDNESNRIVFTTGSLTAAFEGMGPKVTFYDHNSMTRVEQKVNFRALIEFNDADHNGIFESNELVAKAVLDEGKWTHTGFYSLPRGSGVGINFTLADPISLSAGKNLAAGLVVLIVKAYNATQTLTVDGKPVTVTTAEVKFDVVINSWPFQNATNMLALQVNMHSSTEHYDFGEISGTESVDGSHPEGTATAEHEFHQTSGVEQETKLSTGSITTSSTVGFFRFVNKATVTSPTGATSSVPVTASFKSETENDGGDKETFMKLYLAYPNFGQGTLVHDPSVGLGGGFPTLYIILAGAAAAGLITVVIIRRRHPQVQ
jgi:flagellar hook assembly protein FlgD